MVEVIRFVIESSHCLSFQKNFFKGNLARLGSKNKRCLCFIRTFSLYVSYCMF